MSKSTDLTATDWKIKEKRFVAFFDILGFKNYALTNDLDDVHEMLETFININSDELDNKTAFRVNIYRTIFSDSVFIFSRTDSKADFITLTKYIKSLIRKSIASNIPIKGAVAHGEIVVDKNKKLFCGQPIIDAFMLEEDLQYMGIIAHHSIDVFLNDCKSEYLENSYCEIDVPFKYGKRSGLNLNYMSLLRKEGWIKCPNTEEKLAKFKLASSGDARKYIDNTLKIIDNFKERVEKIKENTHS